jgi:hypothetical protein
MAGYFPVGTVKALEQMRQALATVTWKVRSSWRGFCKRALQITGNQHFSFFLL